jgi:hypothetical protein
LLKSSTAGGPSATACAGPLSTVEGFHVCGWVLARRAAEAAADRRDALDERVHANSGLKRKSLDRVAREPGEKSIARAIVADFDNRLSKVTQFDDHCWEHIEGTHILR